MPHPANLLLLAANLQELYAVAETENPRKELVPDPFSHRFFSRCSWQGRLLTYAYKRFSRFNKKWREKALVKIMERTHHSHHIMSQAAWKHYQNVQESFAQHTLGIEVDRKSLRASKHYLTRWNAATAPLQKAVSKGNNLFKTFLRTGLVDKKGKTTTAAPFGSLLTASAFSKYQKVIDFEGVLGAQLPLQMLFRVATAQSLSRKDTEKLGKFAHSLARHQRALSIDKLNKYLRALNKCFYNIEPQPQPPSLSLLAAALAKIRPGLFTRSSRSHLEWRKTLKEGDRLDCGGIEVVLGKPVGLKKNGFDNNLVFEVQNAPRCVVVIGINRLIWPLKAQLAEEMGFGIRNAEVLRIASNGSFALVEKLQTPLNNYDWASNALPLEAEDQEMLHPIVCAIRWFIAQNRIPAHFSPKHLMYDAQGVLKCTKYTVPLPFSFVDMERVIWEISSSNGHVFKYLMENAGMCTHPHARYFRRVVEEVCAGRDPDVSALSQVMQIADHHCIDRARELVEEIDAMKAYSMDILRREGQRLPKNTEDRMGRWLLDIYQEHSAVSTFPTRIEELLIDTVRANLRNR